MHLMNFCFVDLIFNSSLSHFISFHFPILDPKQTNKQQCNLTVHKRAVQTAPRYQFHQHFTKDFFAQKMFCAAFLLFSLAFVIFCHKNISAKASRKMLVKLITGSWRSFPRPRWTWARTSPSPCGPSATLCPI